MPAPDGNSERPRLRPFHAWPRIIAAVGLFFAIAGSLAPRATTSSDAAARLTLPLPNWLVMGVVLCLTATSLLFLVFIWPERRRRKAKDEHQRYVEPLRAPLWVYMLLVAIALLPVGFFAWMMWSDAGWRGWLVAPGREGPSTLPGVPAPDTFPTPEGPPRSASPGITALVGTLALLAALSALGFVFWLYFGDRLRRLPAGNSPAPREAAITAAIEESLEALRNEPDPRIAIIKCYRRFEQTLAAADLPRPPWQTPAEFTGTVLRSRFVPESAVRRLTELFEVARFSLHRLGPSERDRAWQALVDVRDALERSLEK